MPRLNGEFSYLRGLVDEELSGPIVALRIETWRRRLLVTCIAELK